MGSPDSALFWFFSDTNFEVMVKVIDACSFNGFFWVYIAGMTDQEYTVTVLDGVRYPNPGHEQQYFNPLGTRSPAFTDIMAFPCS